MVFFKINSLKTGLYTLTIGSMIFGCSKEVARPSNVASSGINKRNSSSEAAQSENGLNLACDPEETEEIFKRCEKNQINHIPNTVVASVERQIIDSFEKSN